MRRSFTSVTAAIRAAALPCLMAVCACSAAPDEIHDARTTQSVASRFALTLDGVPAGWAAAAFGATPPRTRFGGWRRSAAVPGTYSDLVVRLGVPLDPAVAGVIKSFAAGGVERHAVHVDLYDADGHRVGARDLSAAIVTEVDFPAAEATSSDSEWITLKLSPWTVSEQPGDASASSEPFVAPTPVHAGRFAFEITDLDAWDVRGIDALRLSRPLTASSSGQPRDYDRLPGALTLSNATYSLDAPGSNTWVAWAQSTLVEGVASNGRSGVLTYVDDAWAPQLSITLSGLNPANLDMSNGAIDSRFSLRCTVDALSL